MSEKFSLKWSAFKSNVCNSFTVLRNEDYLQDVTIVTDDNELVEAHKLVLSACSEFFKNIFKKNRHSHPLLCLEGVSSKDIQNLMDYIYNGELHLFQKDLDRFLSIAQRFKLEGLLKTDPKNYQEEVSNGAPVTTEKSYIKEELSEEIPKVKPNISDRHEEVIAKVSVSMSIDPTAENISKINEQIEQNIIRNSDYTFSCQFCGKNSGKVKNNIRNHIESHIVGLSFNCPMCEKTFRTRSSLSNHKSLKHRT